MRLRWVYRWDESEGVEAESDARFSSREKAETTEKKALGDSVKWYVAPITY